MRAMTLERASELVRSCNKPQSQIDLFHHFVCYFGLLRNRNMLQNFALLCGCRITVSRPNDEDVRLVEGDEE